MDAPMEAFARKCAAATGACAEGLDEVNDQESTIVLASCTRKFSMKSPVIFQPLEDELKPLLKYVRGRTLNAGCGSRDISEFLKDAGATSVDNCDLKSNIPGAI